MSRQPRIQFENALYHVFARGVERRAIFIEQDDYKKFQELLSELPDRFNIIIYCYAIMTSHFHLLIETPLANISLAMHYLNSSYAFSFNKKYDRVGHLFQARFGSRVIDEESYLLNVSRYIHSNPLDIPHLSNLEDYKWSSYSKYIFKEQRISWLNCDWILGQFSEDEIEAINLYKKFMNEGSQKDEELFGFDNHDQILGNEEFVEKVFKRKMLKEANEVKEMNFNMQTVTLEDILVRVANEFAVDKDELRIRNINNQLSRKICIYLARRFTNMSNDSIARFFGIKRAAVSMIKQRLDEQICHDNYLKSLISGLMHLITGKDKEKGQAFTDL